MDEEKPKSSITIAIRFFLIFQPTISSTGYFQVFLFSLQTHCLLTFGASLCIIFGAKLSFACVENFIFQR